MQHISKPVQESSDEIDLFEIWQIFVRQKYIFFTCFIFCVLAGVGYIWYKAPVYEASVKIRVGNIGGPDKVLENIEELKARILSDFGRDVAKGVFRERPYVSQITVQRGLSTTLFLVAEGDTGSDAVRLLEKITSDVISRHALISEGSLGHVEMRLKKIDGEVERLHQQFADLSQIIEQLKQRDSVQASIVMIERGPIFDALGKLGEEQVRLSKQMVAPEFRSTELLGEIVVPKVPSQPKKIIVLAIATIFGLFMGVIVAFLVDYFARAKAKNT